MTGETIIDQLGSILYKGKSSCQIIGSITLAIVVLFYVYTGASSLNIRVYPLIDRFTYYTNFQAYVISEFADHILLGSLLALWSISAVRRSHVRDISIIILVAVLITVAAFGNELGLDAIALSSLPAIVSLLIYDRIRSARHQARILNVQDYGLFLNHLAVIGLAIGLIALGLSILLISGSSLERSPVRSYAYEIFLVFSAYSPFILLLLISCIPLKLMLSSVLATLRSMKKVSANSTQIDSWLQLRRQTRIAILLIIVVLSIIIAAIPHLPSVNSDMQQVGVDTGAYVTWIDELKEANSMRDILALTFVELNQGDRPLTLLFYFVVHVITRTDPFIVLEFSPLFLAPSLATVMYFLTRQLTSNEVMSLTAAFLTATSFHTLIGIYAGFYANWIGLIIGYLSFIFLFRFLTRDDKRNLIFFGILTVLLLFIHVYTWSVVSLVGGILLTAILVRPAYAGGKRKNAILLLIVLLCTVVIDVVRTNTLQASGGIESDLRAAGQFVGPEQFILRWNNLTYAVTTYVGGLFANFIILGLGLYWVVKTDARKVSSLFFLIFFSVGILPFFIGEYTIHARIFYNMPFQLPAAIVLAGMLIDKRGTILAISVFAWLIAMSAILLANFYLVPPGS